MASPRPDTPPEMMKVRFVGFILEAEDLQRYAEGLKASEWKRRIGIELEALWFEWVLRWSCNYPPRESSVRILYRA